MPRINIGQDDYNVMKQPYITKFIKIELLNYNMAVVDEISGRCIGCSVSVNANSDIRRTCDVSFIVNDDSFLLSPGGKIFIDKLIKVYVGYENIRTGNIQWYNQGVYLINQPSWAYSADNHTLSFQGVDLMAKLTGMRNGVSTGLATQIPVASNIRSVLIGLLALGGFTQYLIEEAPISTLYDVNTEKGATIYSVMRTLCDMYPSYQIYFDINGVFHYEPIPVNSTDAPIMIDDDLFNHILINQSVNADFESVKNVVEVWGNGSLTTGQPHATAQDNNPNSPFYVGGSAGTIRIVLSGGEYENIGTNDLAQQRANIELYWRCRVKDSISLVVIPVPWLDVNILISHKPNNDTTEKVYLIQSYNVDYGSESGTMTITASSVYQ